MCYCEYYCNHHHHSLVVKMRLSRSMIDTSLTLPLALIGCVASGAVDSYK